MAESIAPVSSPQFVHVHRPSSIDEARAMARRRFKERLDNGEKIGACDCGSETETAAVGLPDGVHVAGVRFLDSGRTFYFDPRSFELEVGDWVVADTSRGREAGRVVIAPHQIRQSMLQGELKPVLRKLSEDDIDRMDRLKRDAAQAVRLFSEKIRA